MPLLKRKPWTPNLVDVSQLGAKGKKSLFFLKQTMEVFDDYTAYSQRMQLLRTRQWSCKFTGKGSLTYDEALAEEEHHRAMLAKFPAPLEGEVLRLVHHCALTLDAAVNKVYDSLKPAAPATEGKENEQIKAKAIKHPLGRTLTRCWIIENCDHVEMNDKRRVWAAKAALAAKHGLPMEWPEGMMPKPTGEQPARDDTVSPTSKSKFLLELKKAIKKGPRTVEEQEATMAAGGVKHVAFQVLKLHGDGKGLNAADVTKKAVELQLWSEEDAQKKGKQIGTVLSTHPEFFARVDKGLYALGALVPGYWEQLDAASAALEAAEEQGKATLQGGGGGAPVAASDGGPTTAAVLAAEPEQDPVARAEEQFRAAQKAVAAMRELTAQAEADVQAAAQAVELERMLIKSPLKRQASEADESAGDSPMPTFSLPPELEEYSGDDNDRKALMAWRKARADAQKVLDRKKEEWAKESRLRREAKRREAAAELRAAEEILKKKESALESLRKQLAAAEKAVLDAHRTFVREQGQMERERARLEREVEKEKRRLEALAAKKYPIEDQELLEELLQKAQETGEEPPLMELPAFSWRYSSEEGQRLELALYVADFLGQFLRSAATYVGPISKQLKLQHLAKYSETLPANFNLAALDRMLGAGLLDDDTPGSFDGQQLDCLYVAIMRFLLEDGEGPMYKLWMNLISEQTWPEILCRYVVARREIDQAPVAERVQFLCALLARSPVDDLHCDHHLVLLQYLCDEMLDTARIRELLDERMEEADDKKRELREGIAEDRKRLRELQEAEKEERKRKREADVAKREALAARRRAVDEMQAEAVKQGKPLDPAVVLQMLEEDVAAAEKEEGMDIDEPSFELPPELQEYKGDPHDRKALLLFRQAQQKEQKRLEKERAKWQAEVRLLRKEAEEKKRLGAEAEKAKEKEKQEALEMLQKRQEDFEKKMETYAIRRQPLGLDRNYRALWCGLAGQRNVLYAQDADGSWSRCTSSAEVENLLELLDKRGVRELQLVEALDKREAGILDTLRKQERKAQAMKQGADAAAAGKEAAERVQPGRRGKPQDLRAQQKEQPPAPKQQDTTTFEERALEWTVEELTELAASAKKANLSSPESWDSWSAFNKDVEGARDMTSQDGLTGPALRKERLAFLQRAILAVEATVFASSKDGQADAADSSSDSEPENDDSEDDEDSQEAVDTPNTKKGATNGHKNGVLSPVTIMLKQAEEMEEQAAAESKDKLKLWGSRKLRRLWQCEVGSAATFGRLAYLASMINELGQNFLDAFKAADKKKQEAARKVQKGNKVDSKPPCKDVAGKAAAKEDSGKAAPKEESRTAASKEASGKVSAKQAVAKAASVPKEPLGKVKPSSKRKAAPQELPPTRRVTRQRS